MKTTSSIAAAAYLLLSSPSLSHAQSCTVTSNTQITFFGWPDNGPPKGPDNAFDCGRGNGPDGSPIAGGTGSYDDPISLATATNNNNLPQCGIVYVPQLRKYFRNEDDCEQCNTDWSNGGKYHVDLWTGSNQYDEGQGLTDCENSLNAGSTIVVNAPRNLPTDTTPLYDPTSGCNHKTYETSDTGSLCSGGSPSGGSPSGGGDGNGQQDGTSPSSTATPTTLATTTRQTTAASSNPGSVGKTNELVTTGGCTWEGHCVGDPCNDYNDCDGSNVCGSDGTCVASAQRL